MNGWLNNSPQKSKSTRTSTTNKSQGDTKSTPNDKGDGEKSKSNFGTCPICGISVIISLINSHVEKCIAEAEGTPVNDYDGMCSTLFRYPNIVVDNDNNSNNNNIQGGSDGIVHNTTSITSDDKRKRDTTTDNRAPKLRKIEKWAPLAGKYLLLLLLNLWLSE